MKLVVHELQSSLTQKVVPTRDVFVAAIRPHIYRHNFASGSLKVQVTDDSDVLIIESDELQIEDIGTEDYFHGYVSFLVNVGLQKDVTYKIKLVGTGYTFSESDYIGWCNGFDLGKYEATYDPVALVRYPFDYEIWERKSK